MVGVAQLVEHWVVAPDAEGSSPFTHPICFFQGSWRSPFFNVGCPVIIQKNLYSVIQRQI